MCRLVECHGVFGLRIMSTSTTGVPVTRETMARENELLAKMEQFATAPGCRRKALLAYFGEDMGECAPLQLEVAGSNWRMDCGSLPLKDAFLS